MRIESSFGTKESWKLPDARPWNKSCVCVFEHAYKYRHESEQVQL